MTRETVVTGAPGVGDGAADLMGTAVADRAVLERTIATFRDRRIALPRFAELVDPSRIPASIHRSLAAVDPDAAHPLNLFRVHWWNDASRRARATLPEHVVLPTSLTGVESPIVVVFGDRFPMIHAHKVLAAYACLVPRLVTGRFDPATQRAVWPSTGNYCRGGVAISRILGCRGVAVLPAGMSAERFAWLERWVGQPEDIVRTPGTESNVKEIYDECARLERDGANVILNQFSEYANHLAHFAATGHALATVYESLRVTRPALRLAVFVSASGSAGTLGAGDSLKERYGTAIVAAEALECPTLLENGFGEHNIQGIGDKHVPLIHNVMNTDVVVGVTDHATDQLGVVFADETGRTMLRERRQVSPAVVDTLRSLGLSSLCNVLAAIATARRLDLGADDAIVTVATDGAAMYASERAKTRSQVWPGGLAAAAAEQTHRRWMLGDEATRTLVLDDPARRRIFNLGYFTWVEQRGVPIDAFVARREPGFWRGLRPALESWDERIAEFNRRAGTAPDA
ncbi:MAG: pyridoxal-phosphate dependent enzyme [Candidatus Eisenbacteria bacterium]